MFEQGLFTYSMVSVPLYDSLGQEARQFVMQECDMRVVVVYNEENVKSILDSNPPASLKVDTGSCTKVPPLMARPLRPFHSQPLGLNGRLNFFV